MKRLFALLLAVLMLLSLAACSEKEDELDPEIAYIVELIEDEDYDMAIHVIEGLRGDDDDSDRSSGNNNGGGILSGWGGFGGNQQSTAEPQHFEESRAAIFDGGDWIFEMDVVNPSDIAVTIQFVEANTRVDGTAVETTHVEGHDLEQMLPQLYLEPHSGYGWAEIISADHFPEKGNLARDYLFYCTAEDGTVVTFVWYFFMEDNGGQGGDTPTQQEQPMEEVPGGQNPDGTYLPIVSGNDWIFEMTITNREDRAMHLWAMDIHDWKNGQDLGTTIFEGDNLAQIGLDHLAINPGEDFYWRDGHPITDEFDTREYRFHFTDENGGGFTESFVFILDASAQPSGSGQNGGRIDSYAGDRGKDLKTLRHDADYEVEVYPGVYWVPAVSLGESRYTNGQIYDMLPAVPEEKAVMAGTLYEALQFYQIGNFIPSDDNQRISENGVNWEHHKPGYYAVLTNTGCCATDSNWLNYMLRDDYDEVGYIATSQRDGSGHIFNYIYEDGWYYIIDLTHYRHSDDSIATAEENGDLNAYHRTDFILGNIHKTRDIQSYVNYVQDTFNDPPGLMFMYTAEDCMAVDGLRSGNSTTIIYEQRDDVKINIIFDDPGDRLYFEFAPAPTRRGDWENQPAWDFMT